MYKLVFCLYASTFICAKQVLKRTEHHYRPRLVRPIKLLVHIQLVVACIFVGYELPSLKVDMRHKVFAPCRFYSRFESQNQYTRQIHLFSQLIARKSLSETHLRIPKKLGYSVGLFLYSLFKIRLGLFHGTELFWTHTEVLSPVLYIFRTGTQRKNSRFYVLH